MTDPVVTFDCAERARFRDAARRRYQKKNAAGIDWSIDRSNALRQETLGIACEVAVARLLGADESPIFAVYGLAGDGGEFDLRGPRTRRRITVKGSRHPGARLIFPPYDDFATGGGSDLAVLGIRHSDDAIRLAGWTTPILWERHAALRDFGRGVGEQLAMAQRHLLPMASLVQQEEQCDTRQSAIGATPTSPDSR